MNSWINICHVEDIPPNIGVCALFNNEQVAIFNCQRTGRFYGISNYDPIGKANVLSRGIIGSIDGQPCVASPLYKQHYNLDTGICLEDPDIKVKVYLVREAKGIIQIEHKEYSNAEAQTPCEIITT